MGFIDISCKDEHNSLLAEGIKVTCNQHIIDVNRSSYTMLILNIDAFFHKIPASKTLYIRYAGFNPIMTS